MLFLSALHSSVSKDTHFNILSWVVFSPFISGKLYASKRLEKMILLGLVRLYFVQDAEDLCQIPTVANFCHSLYVLPSPPKYVWIPEDL